MNCQKKIISISLRPESNLFLHSYIDQKNKDKGIVSRHEINISNIINIHEELVESIAANRHLSVKGLIKDLIGKSIISHEYITVLNNSLDFLKAVNDVINTKGLMDPEDIYNIQGQYPKFKPGMWTRAFVAQKYNSEEYAHADIIDKLFKKIIPVLLKSYTNNIFSQDIKKLTTEQKTKIILNELYSSLRIVYASNDLFADTLNNNNEIKTTHSIGSYKLIVTNNNTIRVHQDNIFTTPTPSTSLNIMKFAIENNYKISPALSATMKIPANKTNLSEENLTIIRDTLNISAENLNFAEYFRILRDTGFLNILLTHDIIPWSGIQNKIQMFEMHEFTEDEHLLVTAELTQDFLKSIINNKEPTKKETVTDKTDYFTNIIKKGINVKDRETVLSLALGSLLHDLAKPISKDERDHPFRAAENLNTLLKPLNLPTTVLEKTKQLIKYHEHFFRFWNKLDTNSPALYLMSEAIENPYPLLLLSITDAMGLDKNIREGHILHEFVNFAESLITHRNNEPVKQEIAKNVINYATWLKEQGSLNNFDIGDLNVKIKKFLSKMDNNYLNHVMKNGPEVVLHHFILQSSAKEARATQMVYRPTFALTHTEIERAFDPGDVLPFNIINRLMENKLIVEINGKLSLSEKAKENPSQLKRALKGVPQAEEKEAFLISPGKYIASLLVKNKYLEEKDGILIASDKYMQSDINSTLYLGSFSPELDHIIEEFMARERMEFQPVINITGKNSMGLLSAISKELIENKLSSIGTYAFTAIDNDIIIDELRFEQEDTYLLEQMFAKGTLTLHNQPAKQPFTEKVNGYKIMKLDTFKYPEQTLIFIEARHRGGHRFIEQLSSLLSSYNIEVSHIKKTFKNGKIAIECIIDNDSLKSSKLKNDQELLNAIYNFYKN